MTHSLNLNSDVLLTDYAPKAIYSGPHTIIGETKTLWIIDNNRKFLKTRLVEYGKDSYYPPKITPWNDARHPQLILHQKQRRALAKRLSHVLRDMRTDLNRLMQSHENETLTPQAIEKYEEFLGLPYKTAVKFRRANTDKGHVQASLHKVTLQDNQTIIVARPSGENTLFHFASGAHITTLEHQFEHIPTVVRSVVDMALQEWYGAKEVINHE